MAQAQFMMSTDWHFTNENSKELIDILKQKFILANELGLKRVYVLGDIFVSRISQRMEILDKFWDVLNLALEYDIEIFAIPGNHDKTDYKSDRSFLRFYQHHPSLTLVENHLSIVDGEFEIHLMPFFAHNCDKFKENFIKCCTPEHPTKKQILMAHFAVEGSINNDGTKVNYGSKPSEFKDFHMVFLGHYHNMHTIGDNIMHIPSIRQNNFGEDVDKGFMIMYDDEVLELYPPEFTQYLKFRLDLDTMSFAELMNQADIMKEQAQTDNIRFILTGGEAEIRSLDITPFSDMGIDVKKNIKGFIPQLIDAPAIEEVMEFTQSDILERFQLFCDEKKLSHEDGLELLQKILLKNTFIQ